MDKQKIVWFILDEILVKHSATHGKRACMICGRAIEAMELLEKPTPEECKLLYEQRRGL